MDILEQAERRVTKIFGVLQHPSCEERLRELRLSSLENKMLQGDSIPTFQYLLVAKMGTDFLIRPVATGQG